MIVKKLSIIALIVICFVVIAGVLGIFYIKDIDPEDDEPSSSEMRFADETGATAESVNSLVDSLNDFSFEFYNQIISNDDGNIFYSPYSIFTALSMAYEGADGNTATEMKNILNILQDDPVTEASFGRLYNLLNQNQDGYKISTANAFWANQDYTFLDSYLNLLENYYMAEANSLDFSQNVEAANTINSWIEEQTNNKIKDMIKPIQLSVLTKLVLTNAIYFKGQWETEFDPDSTYETDFELSNGETVTVDMMMNSDDAEYFYTSNDDLKILEIDYKGNDLSMIIILPKENDISIAENAINSNTLSNWKQELVKMELSVQIPKFTFETDYNLNNLLTDMGMDDAFIPGLSDFSKMDGTKNLFISDVIHKAFVEVNEEGTEAAAATAIIMGETSIEEPLYFKADHPFLFLIQQKETGAILFTGRVMDPSV